jgi:hypothetical protein
MGATITTRCQVQVIETPSGPGYLLFEETFEKNVYPHRPHWSCIGVGRREDALKRIFAHAASCEGGMLQTPSGDITPEGYIGRWKKVCDQASAYRGHPTGEVGLNMKDHKPWHLDSVQIPDDLECPLTDGQRCGWNRGMTVVFSLAEEFDKIAWLVNRSRASSWKVFDFFDNTGHEIVQAEIFLDRTRDAPKLALPNLVRLFERDEPLFSIPEDGTLTAEGWAYSHVGSFISGYAAVEAEHPGWYAKQIKAYRHNAMTAPLLTAPVLGQDCIVVPFARDDAHTYMKESVAALLAQYPEGVRLSDVTDGGARYRVAGAPSFRVISVDAAATAPLQAGLFA